MLPPKKIFFGLLFRCPKCGGKVRKQKYTEFATAFASTSIFLVLSCKSRECGWENFVRKD
jgi:hypothetical protein